MSINVDWKALIRQYSEEDERLFASRGAKITICIHPSILEDVERQIERTMTQIGMEHGNAAKIAGVTAFWIHKLRPLYIKPNPESPQTYTMINELVSIQVGVAIC